MPAKKKNKKKKEDKADPDDDFDDFVAEVKRLGVYEGLVITETPKYQPAPSSKDDHLIKLINSNQKQWGFFIANSPTDVVGRRAIANQNLPSGFTLVRESGYPWIVQREHERRVCHQCTTELDAKAVGCVTCERAFYCSEACQTKALPIHRIECKCLASKYEENTGVDPDLMRTGLAYLVRRKHVSTSSSASGVDFEPCEGDMLNMVFHSAGLSDTDREACVKGAQALRSGLPPEYHLSDSQITDFFCRVNANSHGLSYPSGPPDRQFGLGLFPLCAIFNHSCYPNVVFLNEGNRLVFRVIRPVQKGEELCVNYIALYQSRRHRRHELWISKHFVCNCRRCNLTPNSVDEIEHFVNDKLLDGICCRGKKDCKGYYQPSILSSSVATDEKTSSPPASIASDSSTPATSTSTPTTTAPTTNSPTTTAAAPISTTTTTTSTTPMTTTTKSKKKGAKSSAETTTTATNTAAASTPTPSTETSASTNAVTSPTSDLWRCADCGHTVSYEAVLAPVEQEVMDTTSRAIAELEHGKGSVASKRELLEGVLRRFTGVVAPQYACFFNVYLGLANVCGNLNDQRARLDYIRLVLKYSELVFPKNFLPSATFYRVLADSIDKTVAERNEKGLNNKAIVAKYLLEKREALTTHYEITSLCCGPSSLRARESKAILDRAIKAL